MTFTVAALSLVAFPASAATGGFPPPNTPFTIKTVLEDGKARCVSRAENPRIMLMRFRPCDTNDKKQQFVQRSVDARGYGIVWNVDGSCLVGKVIVSGALCKGLNPTNSSWKQASDGRVVNNGAKRLEYWGHVGSGDTATFSIGPLYEVAAKFDLLPLPSKN
ncbi:hypothetical protein [Streptomyces sp. NBC_00388]|uniref:hypothetical protein n=1 Tax=Streptomyces sp. NBC_00388 TaxID=2975735 RepID=UPI002E24CDC5